MSPLWLRPSYTLLAIVLRAASPKYRLPLAPLDFLLVASRRSMTVIVVPFATSNAAPFVPTPQVEIPVPSSPTTNPYRAA